MMQVIQDVSLLLNAVFFGLSLFVAVILWTQTTEYRRSNRILSVLLLTFAITTFNTIIRLTPYADAMGFYEDISNAVLLIMGPSMFLFIQIRLEDLPIGKTWIHFLPFAIYVSLIVIEYFQLMPFNKDQVDTLAFMVFVIQWVVYITLSYVQLGRFEHRVKQNFSNLDKHDLRWIKVILITLLTTLVLRIGMIIYGALVDKVAKWIELNLTLVFSLSICYLGYMIFKNPKLFIKIPGYSNSSLSAEDLQSNKKKLAQTLEQERLYLNPKLTISELAQATGLHSRQISQTINQEINQNFFDYINTYRVKALIEMLNDPSSQKLKLYALMQEAGFHSPSVAYTAFKKITGTTPSQFRKSQSTPGATI